MNQFKFIKTSKGFVNLANVDHVSADKDRNGITAIHISYVGYAEVISFTGPEAERLNAFFNRVTLFDATEE